MSGGEDTAAASTPAHVAPVRRRIWGPPPRPGGEGDSKEPPSVRARAPLLLLTVFVIATCGLVYELLASTLASFVLGDAVTQYSTVIGVYLSAMGVGAWLSRFVDRAVARSFVDVEIALALVGGASAPVLFLAFAHLSWFRVVLYAVVLVVGTLVGMEIPLLLRLLRARYDFKDLVARVLTVDYVGALVGSLAFPLFLVPRLGLVRSSLVMGALNALTGLASTWLLGDEIGPVATLRARAVVVLTLLVAGAFGADRLTLLAEEGLYADDIVYAKQTEYQRIVVTRGKGSFQLFLNGNLQFSSADEYRYHEALVWPAVAVRAAEGRPTERVLVLGGGDGLALREIEHIPGLREVTLVDLDPQMTKLASTMPLLRDLNEGSFADERVRVVNADAFVWLSGGASTSTKADRYDAIFADFPDPNHYSLGKLYTTRIYARMAAHLSEGGVIAVQSTSPLFARRSFWCIARTLEKAGMRVLPYHASVPSFGEWGFVLARPPDRGPLAVPQRVPTSTVPLRHLDDETLRTLFVLPRDMARVEVEINRLDNQVLVHYYEAEWKRFL